MRVDDISDPTWEQMEAKVMLSPNQPLKFGVERGGKVMEEVVVPEPAGRNQMGDVGWVPQEPSVISATVEPGMPAEKAGLRLGDQILTANGQEIPAVQALIQMLKRTKDQPLEIIALRNGQRLAFTVKPTFDQSGGGQEPAYRIGIASSPHESGET